MLLKSLGFKKKIKVEGRACYEGQLLAPAPALAPYGYYLGLLYVCDSGVPILYHEFKSLLWVFSIPWDHVYNMSPCQYHESMSKAWVLANNMTIPRVQVNNQDVVNTMSPCLYCESMLLPWVLVTSKRYQKVQEVPQGPRGTIRSKRYQQV